MSLHYSAGQESSLGASELAFRVSVAHVISVLMLSILVLVPVSVSANPIPADTSPFDASFYLDGDPAAAVAFLFFVNLLTNFVFYVAGLLVISRKWGKKAMSLPKVGWQFISMVIVAVVFITLVGAFVDYYVAAQDYANDSGEVHRAIIWDSARWFIATALILLSIFVASSAVISIRWDVALMLSVFMALVSPLWWVLSGLLGSIVTFVTIVISLLVAPVLLGRLLKWFNRVLHSGEYNVA